MAPRTTLDFSGFQWHVKARAEPVGPGPNWFDDRPETVRLADDGLHLCLHRQGGAWRCAEVIAQGRFGYGSYVFQFVGPLDQLDPNVVLGLFTWDPDPTSRHNREIDIEVARWGDPAAPNLNFVVQPAAPERHHQAALQLAGTHSTYRIRWAPGRISFDALHGHHGHAPVPGPLIASWDFRGPEVPKPGGEQVRVNLWLRKGLPPLDGRGAEVVLKRFAFRAG